MNTPKSIGLVFFAAPEQLTGLPTSITLPGTIRVGQKVTLVGRVRTPNCKVVVVKPAVVTLQTPQLEFITYRVDWMSLPAA